MRTSLADKYILPSGNKPAPEIVEIPVPAALTKRWTAPEKMAFAEMTDETGMGAIYVCGTPVPVSGAVHDKDGHTVSSWGGLTGVRLVRIGITSAAPWLDKLTAMHSRGPIPVQLIGRLWVPTDTAVVRFEQLCDQALGMRAVAPEVNNYYALPHDTDDRVMLASLKDLARKSGIQWCEDDTELHHSAQRLVQKAMGHNKTGRH